MRLADLYAILCQNGGPPPDVFAFLDAHAGRSARERADVLLIDQGNRWRAGARLPAECYLRRFPDVAADPELRLDLVYGEIHHAFENGEKSELTRLGERFPDLRNELFRQFEVADWVLAGARGDERDLPTAGDFGASSGTDVSALEHSGRFSVLRWLGAGGMGVVYEAFDRKRGERVALKALHLGDPAALFRFKQEFRALVGVRHPNLVTLHELFSSRGRWFFTMELVDGIDFLAYVRGGWAAAGREPPGSPSRLTRLRGALRQLAAGTHGLHVAGWLHRDIKPTNVLVTRQGRVVLLDFGLAAELMASGEHLSTERHVLGTFSYMSPEQAAGRAVSPGSDWYSVGTMLFEALTDRLPFDGHPLLALERKYAGPLAPSAVEPEVPPELDALCVDLLRPEPGARPTGGEVLCRLAPTASAQPVPAAPMGASLFGRGRHLRELDEAFEIVRGGRPVVVFVRGRSGVGKSALVQHFLDGVTSRGAAVALAGRCYEQESVPFKAIDSVIDALTGHLKRLTPLEAQAVLPRDVGPLSRMFPVLLRANAVAAAAGGRTAADMTGAQELRRRAFAALRELLARLGDRCPLVVSIDDIQWGDPDSALLLGDLLSPPDPPVLLLLASFRSEDEATSPVLEQLLATQQETGASPERRILEVEDLSRADAHKLARALLGPCEATLASHAEEIACESGGNPFFISELVQAIAAGRGQGLRDALGGEVRLSEVLWSRVLGLPDDARRLIEIVAAYGQPLAREDACRAAGLAPADHAAVDALKTARLLRGASPAGRDLIETYHDRVRETVVAHIPAERMAGLYEALAEALEASDAADPEALAVLFHGAGRTEKAGAYYAEAAEHAAQTLAYDRATTLYRKALAFRPEGGPSEAWLRAGLADALANAGQGALAAQEYLLAAMESDIDVSFELERRAAMHLLMSGHVDDGLALLRMVLAGRGLALPKTPKRALAALLLRRLLIRIRGIGPRSCKSAPAAGRTALLRIDVCLAAAAGLGGFDPIRGASFQALALLLALREGEPHRIARALAMEAAHVAAAGGRSRARTEKLLRTAGELARGVGRPELYGLVSAMHGVAAFLEGRFRDCVTHCDRAEETFRERRTGANWELDTAQAFALRSLPYLGELAELRRRWSVLLTKAGERGDLFVVANQSVHVMTVMKLAEDDPEGADAELTRVMGRWSRQGHHVQHYHALRARALIELYRGEAENAWRRISDYHATFRASLLSRIQFMRIEMLQLHARAALAASAAGGGRPELLRAAAHDAHRLERERMPWSDALARLVRAGVAAARGDLARSALLLEEAVDRFGAAEMNLFAAAARRQLGRLLTDGRRTELIADAEAWLARQGIRDIDRFCAMAVPAFPS